MKTYFIEESKKEKSIISIICKIKYINNKIIINKKLKNTSLKGKIFIKKKIKKILERDKVRYVAIENRIKEDEQFINLLYSNNIKICSPKWIFKKCTEKLVDSILKDNKKEESEISLCVNEVDNDVEKYIFKFARKFKKMNIITNHIGKFKKIEEKLYNEDGILINVTNNRRKGLLNAKLIINIDFPKEMINDFEIYDKSTIINWDEPMKIHKKRFNGKIIEEVKINLEKESKIASIIKDNNLKNFDERDVCQAFGIIPNQIYIY